LAVLQRCSNGAGLQEAQLHQPLERIPSEMYSTPWSASYHLLAQCEVI